MHDPIFCSKLFDTGLQTEAGFPLLKCVPPEKVMFKTKIV